MKLTKCFHSIIPKKQSLLSKSILFVILIAVFVCNLNAQRRPYSWELPYFVEPDIPENLLTEDAIILNQIDVLSVEPAKVYFSLPDAVSSNDYELITFKYVKLKILTLNGLEKYANPEFLLKMGSSIEVLDGRVIKTNHCQFFIDSADIVEANARNTSGTLFSEDFLSQKIKIAFPNVEVGDVIEYVYSYKTPGFKPTNLSGEVVLNAQIPILNADYLVRVPRDMEIFYKLYNNFRKPEANATETDVNCKFNQKNIPSLYNSELSNLQSQMPFFYFQVIPGEVKNLKMDWDFIYKTTYTFAFSEVNLIPLNKNYYKKWKSKLLKDYKDSTKTLKFKVLYNDIRDNMVVKDAMSEFEMAYSSGYFLKAGYINKLNLMRLYKKIFEDLGISYYICFARNKYKDPINYDDIRKDEATDIFFIYIDENGKNHFVFPGDEIQSFEIDELPNNLLGTDAIMMKHTIDKTKPFSLCLPDLADFIKKVYKQKYDFNIEKKTVFLPEGKVNSNYITQQNSITINLDDLTNQYKNNIKLSGALSTKYRTFFSLMDKNRDLNLYYATVTDDLYKNYQKDTSYVEKFKRSYPFEFKLVNKGEIKNLIETIDTNLYSISLKDVIFHDIINLPDKERIFNVIPEFIYTDMVQVFFYFDKPVKQINSGAFNYNVENEFGSYSVSSREMSDKSIMVSSQYTIKTNLLPYEKFKFLTEINQSFKKAVLTKLVIRKL
ncbi:MAG: DUF3857 domain-containing protein [Bacteroidales bacterium]